jgi:hypothetical protein
MTIGKEKSCRVGAALSGSDTAAPSGGDKEEESKIPQGHVGAERKLAGAKRGSCFRIFIPGAQTLMPA